MRYLLVIFTLISFATTSIAQEDTTEYSDNKLLKEDSIHFHNLLDSVKLRGIKDSAEYQKLRLAGIIYMNIFNHTEAVPFLDISYAFEPHDTVTNTLLYEALMMKVYRQQNATTNITDITSYRKKYPHLRDSLLLTEIIYKDAVKLIMSNFEKEDLKTINAYYDIAIKEFISKKNKSIFLETENTEVMFFNVALLNYLKKNNSKAAEVLKLGSNYYPNNKDMKALKNHMNKVK